MKRSWSYHLYALAALVWLGIGAVSVQAQPAPGTADFDPANPPTQTMVMRGETLFTIAERTRSPLQGLIRANNLRPPYAIAPGQVLALPALKVHVVATGDTFLAIARRYSVDERSLAVFNRLIRPVQVRLGQRIILPPMVVDRFTGLEPQDLVDLLANEISAGREVTGAQPGQITRNSEASSPNTPTSSPKLKSQFDRPIGPLVDSAGASSSGVLSNGPSEDGDGTSVTPRPGQSARPTTPPRQAVALSPSVRPPATRPPVARPATSLPSITDLPSPSVGNALAWPLSGRIVETFGAKRDLRTLDGIEIEAPAGTPFKAAASGTVAYVGNQIAGYGWLVLIRHANGLMSAYAYAQSVNVRENETVSRGQVIGLVGTTGRASTPRLHFQVRQNTYPVDPIPRLPRVRAAV